MISQRTQGACRLRSRFRYRANKISGKLTEPKELHQWRRWKFDEKHIRRSYIKHTLIECSVNMGDTRRCCRRRLSIQTRWIGEATKTKNSITERNYRSSTEQMNQAGHAAGCLQLSYSVAYTSMEPHYNITHKVAHRAQLSQRKRAALYHGGNVHIYKNSVKTRQISLINRDTLYKSTLHNIFFFDV